MSDKIPRARRALAAALMIVAALPLLVRHPAEAEPPRSRIVAIYDADRCANEVCGPGDPVIGPGDPVTGTIQVHVHSEATLGLEWVRLQAHVEGTPAALEICLQQWRPPAGTFSFDAHYTWDTRVWPDPSGPESDCEHQTQHYHREATKNARYMLRAVARERPPERDFEGTSPTFEVRLRNTPVAPRWASDPSVSSGATPRVVLTWKANPEERTQPSPDIVEYHFVRIGSGGDEQEFAVNAADPTRQGCSRFSTLYRCTDRNFARSGEYRYALLAFRAGAGRGERCATDPGTCVESPLSTIERVSVMVAGPAVATTTSASATPSVGPSADESTGAPIAPVEVAPPPDRSEQLAAAEREGRSAGPAVPVAAGLVLALIAAHLARTLRRSL